MTPHDLDQYGAALAADAPDLTPEQVEAAARLLAQVPADQTEGQTA